MRPQIALFAFLIGTVFPAQLDEPQRAKYRDCNRAGSLIGQRKWSDALGLLQSVISREPHLTLAYKHLAAAYDGANQWDAAEIYLQGLLQRDPNNGLIHFALGRAYAARKQYARADSHYRACIGLAPQGWDCYQGLVSSYHEQRRVDDVIDEMQSRVARSPGNPAPCLGLAEAYRLSPRLADALRVYRACLPVAEAAGNRWLLTTYLLQGALLISSSGQDWAEAIAVLQRALPLAEAEGDEEQVLTALEQMAYCKGFLEHFDTARDSLKQLIARSQEGGNATFEAQAQTMWGDLSSKFGAFDEAVLHFTEAIQIFERIGNESWSINVSQRLDNVFLNQGDYPRAIAAFQRSLDAAEAMGSDYYAGWALRMLGNAYGDMGEHWRELDYHIRSTERVEGSNPHMAGAGLGSIGSAYFALGDYEKAKLYYRRALASAVKFDDAGEQERHLSNLGELFIANRDYRQARQALEKALSFADRVGNARFKGGILITLADVHKQQRDYQSALRLCSEGLALARSRALKILEGAALNTLGDILMRSGDTEGGRKAFIEALSLGSAIGLQDIVWPALKGLGDISAGHGLLDEAFGHFQSAIQILEAMRAALPSPTLRTSFLEEKLEVYESTLNVLFRLDKLRPGAGYDRLAFRYMEQSRARVFLETLTESQSNVRKGLTQDQVERHAALLREYSRAASKLLKDSSAPARETVSKIEEKLDRFLAEVRLTNPRYAELVSSPPYTAEQAQADAAHLGIKLIAYFLGHKQSLGWLVTANTFVMVPLPPRAEVENQVRRYRAAIAKPPRSEWDLGAYLQPGEDLYRTLLAPMARHLRGPGSLVVIPDGILYYLPFETLVRPTNSGDRSRFVAEDTSIVYAPSAAVFDYLSRENHTGSPTGPMDLLAYGDPEFGSVSKRANQCRSVVA